MFADKEQFKSEYLSTITEHFGKSLKHCGKTEKYTTKLIKFGGKEARFSGTGDIFSSIVMGKILSGFSVFDAANDAVKFIGNAISKTCVNDRNDGIDFEKFLKDL